ncbi:MAG: alpha-1,2-fucosyltransferase [Chlamydiia bacterium]
MPDLVHVTDVGVPENHARFFHHIPCWSCPEGPIIREAEELRYHPLPESPNMVLLGWFQTERYFADYRDDILKLFSFREGHWESLLSQYPKLSHPCKIGVQIRIPFHPTLDHPDFHPLFGRGYFEQAFRTLPQDALYVVVSNHVGAAKDLLSGLELNFLYLSDTDRFDDLLILSKCQHVISSNSTFGWWGAWLGDRPGRRCIFPAPWFAPHGRGREDTKDLIPERWEVIFCPEAIIPPHINPTLNCSSKNPADAIFK